MSSQAFIEVRVTLTSLTPPYNRTHTVRIQLPAFSTITFTYLRYVVAGAVETALLLPDYSVTVGTIEAWWDERFRFIDRWGRVVHMPSRIMEGNVREVLECVERGRGYLEARATRRAVEDRRAGERGGRDRERGVRRHPCGLRSDRSCNCRTCTNAGCIIGMSGEVYEN